MIIIVTYVNLVTIITTDIQQELVMNKLTILQGQTCLKPILSGWVFIWTCLYSYMNSKIKLKEPYSWQTGLFNKQLLTLILSINKITKTVQWFYNLSETIFLSGMILNNDLFLTFFTVFHHQQKFLFLSEKLKYFWLK